MARSCSVCNHPSSDSINKLLSDRAPYREITRKFGISKSSLSRHKRNCIAACIQKAEEADAVRSAESFLEDIVELF